MKIELVKVDGKFAGWNIVATNEQEKRQLGSIRNAEFDNLTMQPVYDGCETETTKDENGNTYCFVTKIKYRLKEKLLKS